MIFSTKLLLLLYHVVYWYSNHDLMIWHCCCGVAQTATPAGLLLLSVEVLAVVVGP